MPDDVRAMLDELERLEKAATPPPWWVPSANVGRVMAGDEREKTLLLVVNDDHENAYFGSTSVSYADVMGSVDAGHREAADRRLIAAARNALPTLIRLARRGLEAGEVVEGTVLHGGVVRKVIGEFKLTDDGAIACEEATCWGVYRRGDPDDPEDVWKVGECRRTGRYDDYGCWWQFDDCEEETVDVLAVYSSKELAEAAVVSENAKPKDPKPEVFDSILEEIQAKAARAALSRFAAKEER